MLGILLAAVHLAFGQFSGGSGTELAPYLIGSAADLNAIRTTYLGTSGSPIYYQQTADIDLGSISNWQPIGAQGTSAYVHYDGAGHSISNLTITRSGESSIGLFGWLSGSIRNLSLDSGSVEAFWYVGSLVGRLDSGTISNCASKVSVTGVNNVGGLVGWNQTGTIRFSAYRGGTVSGNNTVGGLIGFNSGGTLSGCYSAAGVSGTGNTGGLIGSGSGTVADSYWDTTVSGQMKSRRLRSTKLSVKHKV